MMIIYLYFKGFYGKLIYASDIGGYAIKDFITKQTTILPERPMVDFEIVTTALNNIRCIIPFAHLLFIIHIQAQEEDSFYKGVPFEKYHQLLNKRLDQFRKRSIDEQTVFPLLLDLLPNEISEEVTRHLISADIPISAIDDRSPPHNSICHHILFSYREIFFKKLDAVCITSLQNFFICQIESFKRKKSKKNLRLQLCPKHLHKDLNTLAKLSKYLFMLKKSNKSFYSFVSEKIVDNKPKISRKRKHN